MKFKSLIIPLTMVALLSVGCSKNDKNNNNANENTPPVTDNNGGTTNNSGTGENKADMVTSPS